MWSSSGGPVVAASPRGGRRWCGWGRRTRGGGRAARQRDQRGKRDVGLLHGPAGKHHRQQWVGRQEAVQVLSCFDSVTIPQTNSAPTLQFSQLWPHICAWPCLFVCLCLQFPAAGGAPRGWITPCTVPTFWPPSPLWLCPTSFTPPTGNPLTSQRSSCDR